jgi:acyl-CoA synthetase
MNTILSLFNEPQARDFSARGWWRDETIYGAVADRAGAHPERVAILERERAISYADLVNAADRLAGAWTAAGLRPGARVAIWLPSRAEVAAAVLACSRRGFVACPSLHRDHTVADVAMLIGRMRASAVISQSGWGADADEHDIRDQVATMDHVVCHTALAADPGRALFTEVIGADDAPPDADPNSVVYLAFTSGTTGSPKGVMHSDNTLLAPTRALAADWHLDATTTIYSLSPLSHNLGFGAMLLALTMGAQFVVHDLPRGRSLLHRLRETEAAFVFGVPTHAIDLLAELRESPAADLPSLRGFRVSGAAIPPTVAQGLLDHGIVPQSGYGMTEAGSHHYTMPDTPAEAIVGSSGRSCAGYEVAIFSQADTAIALPPGEVGQIGGRGASLMLGYFDDQRATEESFNRDGWFLTGDLGWLDDDGYLHITGRKKEIIIRGGHNIFPAKVENLAMRHSAVGKAAAVPVAYERLGERVCLVLQLRPGRSITADELFEHLKVSGLSRYDMPEYWAFVAEMPLTASGKILKRALIERIAAADLPVSEIRYRRVPADAQTGR